MAQLVAHLAVSRCVVGSNAHGAEHFGFPPVFRDWVMKGLGICTAVSMQLGK